MIILEGHDRCGKTTAARRLRELLPNWAYRHFDFRPIPAFEYYAGVFAYGQRNTIVDRSFYSEMVYGPMFRGASQLPLHEEIMLELYALANRSVVLLFEDAPAKVVDRMAKEKGSDLTFKEQSRVAQILRHYQTIARNSSLDFIAARPFDEEGHGTIASRAMEIEDEESSMKTPPPFIAAGKSLGARFIIVSSGNDLQAPSYWSGVEFPLNFDVNCRDRRNLFLTLLEGEGVAWDKGVFVNASRFDPYGLANFITGVRDSKLAKSRTGAKIIYLDKDAAYLADALVKQTAAKVEVHHCYAPQHASTSDFSDWMYESILPLLPKRTSGDQGGWLLG